MTILEEKDQSKWLSRKLIVTGTALVLGFAAMWADAQARSEFYSLMQWIVPAYLGGQSVVDAIRQMK